MKLTTRITLPLALTALAITGCSGQDTPAETGSPTQSVSASPTPSASSTASKTPTGEPSSKPTRTATATPAPTTAQAEQPAPADDGMTTSLTEFLATGGVCFADYFPAGPLTDAATAEVQDYCASQAPAAAPVVPEDERAECEALDPATASSGAIQYCYMEYGIDPAAPLREQDPYAGLSDDELAELPVTGMP